ncbi:MAG TPA: PQQ-dependent sugar dehydrogenase [Thermoanaerobaculia bacterium]
MANLSSSLPAPADPKDIKLDTIKLPPGFRISVYTDAVPGARSMAMGPKGTLFVGSRGEGAVYAVVDAGDGTRAREVLTLAKNLDEPNGVAVKDGALYVMEVSRLLRFDGIEERLKSSPAPVVVSDAFPKDPHHGWKFVAFGPDGLLYVPIGAPCNICRRSDPYASIARLKSDGSLFEIVARGVRNSVGFDWHPGTKELWFTDNGRDLLGDDSPPDELNRAPHSGLHFGFPYCHGGDVSDPEFGKELPCKDFVPPALKLGAHVAALGMRFYTGATFPAEYRGQIFIAEHGSWNRKKKVGYRVALVRLRDGKPVSEEVFAEGWLQGEKAWGRPVDVLVRPDGSLLVSDDQAGAIYRISFGK